jgi:hypothetical protein
MGCVLRVARTLEGCDGVQKVTFEPQTETFLLEVNTAFRLDDAAQRVRLAGKEHDAWLGWTHNPEWVITQKEQRAVGQ